jgi:hypothetical protein
MSYTKPLAERERALEEAFFRKESERLLAAMRERKSREARIEALSAVLGLRDERIIEPLLDLGIREENVTALVMAPLVAVAWADRTLDNEERYYLLEAENDLGIDPKSAAGELLAVWLSHRPHENLIDAWAAYVKELCRVLEPAERARLHEDVSSWSWRIARAIEKSFLRGGGPSDAERAVLDRIEEAFQVEAEREEKENTSGDRPDKLDRAITSMS